MDNIDRKAGVLDKTVRHQERFDNSNLSKASLQNLEYALQQLLGLVQKAQGKRKDPVQRLCDSATVPKQTLAIAMIYELDGHITGIELARRLHIHPSTLRKRSWRKVRDLLVRIR